MKKRVKGQKVIGFKDWWYYYQFFLSPLTLLSLTTLNSSFQSVEYIFCTLEYIFHTLEYIFYSLECKILSR